MLKKFFPLIALLAAALLFFWIKQNQRGKFVPNTVNTTGKDPFNRNTPLIYSKHARCRMDCRHIDESEVKEILQKGEINYSKIEEGEQGRSYPLEGTTHDQQHVRIVFAPHENELVVVTVIDLEKEWECDCN